MFSFLWSHPRGNEQETVMEKVLMMEKVLSVVLLHDSYTIDTCWDSRERKCA